MRFKKYFFLALITPLIMLTDTGSLQAEQPGRWFRRQPSEPEPPLHIETHFQQMGLELEVHFTKGRHHNHPLMAIWIEDMQGNYLQTLYVAQSIAEGVFRHGDPSSGRWMPGAVRRPAALPYWGHQRGVQASDGLYLPEESDPMPDGLTGATPKSNFVLHSAVPGQHKGAFRVLFEINQSWDWNKYWTNDKFPGDRQYMSSSQPALVYEAVLNPEEGIWEAQMKPIGHSHWSGRSGELFPDLSTLTTALEIASEIRVKVNKP